MTLYERSKLIQNYNERLVIQATRVSLTSLFLAQMKACLLLLLLRNLPVSDRSSFVCVQKVNKQQFDLLTANHAQWYYNKHNLMVHPRKTSRFFSLASWFLNPKEREFQLVIQIRPSNWTAKTNIRTNEPESELHNRARSLLISQFQASIGLVCFWKFLNLDRVWILSANLPVSLRLSLSVCELICLKDLRFLLSVRSNTNRRLLG